MAITHQQLIAAFAMCFLGIGTAYAQVRSSTITGTVHDPSGAAVVHAAVSVTNQETNAASVVNTNEAGVYVAPYLPEGRYSVRAEAPGFQQSVTDGIVIGTATTVRVNVALAIGSVATAVEVHADAQQLQTENAVVSDAVTAKLIADLPNITNNPLYYAILDAGVVPNEGMYNGQALGVGFASRQQFSSFRINGGATGTNDIQLDGVSVQGAAWHEVAVVPDRDSLQEVRVTSNTFSAETGGGQGVVSMTTKSGANAYHGTLSYRLRNEGLNANTFFNNENGYARPKYRVNDGSGSIGGPVIIPKVFNGKNKLFFFADYERMTHQDPLVSRNTVPTDAQRVGNEQGSMISDASGNPIQAQIWNPYSAVPYQASNQTYIRSPYPNNIVPNPNQFGMNLLKAYPGANATPTDAYGHNNFVLFGSMPTVRNSLVARGDYRVNDKVSVYMTSGFAIGHFNPTNAWGSNSQFWNNNGIPWPGKITDSNPYGAIGTTITLTPTTVLDVRYGLTRINTVSGFPGGNLTNSDYANYGMPASLLSLVMVPGSAPSVGGLGYYSGLQSDQWTRKSEHQTNHVITGSVTKVAGKWTLKSGAEYRAYLGNWQDGQHGTPSLDSSDSCTEQYSSLNGCGNSLNTTPIQGGFGGALAAVGVGGWTLQPGGNVRNAYAAKYIAFYTQNDWKVTNRLTVNLGLRYEIQPGPTERFNRMSAFDPKAGNPFATGVTATGLDPLALQGAIAFPGINGYSRNAWETQWNNIAPRIGVAYRLTDATVVRGGYGRTYAPSNTGFNANNTVYGTAPFSAGSTALPFGITPNGIPGQFSNPASSPISPAAGPVQAADLYGNGNAQSGVTLFQRSGYKNAVADQWNVAIERRFRTWMVSATYVGARGSDLPWRGYPLNGSFNTPISELQSWFSTNLATNGANYPGNAQVPNPLPKLIGGAIGNIGNTNITLQESQYPNLGFLGQTVLASKGSSTYHAFQFRVNRAYENGLQVQANYSYSHDTGIIPGAGSSSYAESQSGSQGPGGGFDYRNIPGNRGILPFDVPNRFVGVVSYLLPTGKGKALDPGNKFLRALIGDWNLATVVTLQTGLPWGPSCGTLNGKCDQVAGQSLTLPKSYQKWYDGNTPVTLPDGRTYTPPAQSYLIFNPDAFTQPTATMANGTVVADSTALGTTGTYMSDLRVPAFKMVNISINRKFRLTEKTSLELVADATNAFNKVNLSAGSMNNGFGLNTVADPAAHSAVGQNNNSAFGTQSLSSWQGSNTMDARQVTLSMKLRF